MITLLYIIICLTFIKLTTFNAVPHHFRSRTYKKRAPSRRNRAYSLIFQSHTANLPSSYNRIIMPGPPSVTQSITIRHAAKPWQSGDETHQAAVWRHPTNQTEIISALIHFWSWKHTPLDARWASPAFYKPSKDGEISNNNFAISILQK